MVLHCITSSTFFVVAKILAHLLASLRGLTVKLQGRSTDIFEAYSLVSEVQPNLSLCRENIDQEFHNLFQDITDEADKIGIEIMVSRQIEKRKNRCNVPAANAQEFYRRSLMRPVLDHNYNQRS